MILKIILTLLVGLLGGLAARRLGLPAAFMTGSMLAVAVFSIGTEAMYVPGGLKTCAQIISGAYIGQQVTKEDVRSFPKIAKAIALLLLLFTVNALLMTQLFTHFFHFDVVTAYLATLPGGIMDVSLISIDMGAQSEIVATMQLARLVCMLVIIPQWTKFVIGRFGQEKPAVPRQLQPKVPFGVEGQLTNNLLILCVAGVGGLLGWLAGIPAGALTFSLLFSFALKLLKNTAPLASSIRFAAQILAGSIIGSTFTRNSLAQFGQLLLPIVLLLLSYLLVNLLFSYLMSRSQVLDLQSALFASSPAGATDISLIAGDLGGDLAKIAGIQISRVLYTIIVMPNLLIVFLL